MSKELWLGVMAAAAAVAAAALECVHFARVCVCRFVFMFNVCVCVCVRARQCRSSRPTIPQKKKMSSSLMLPPPPSSSLLAASSRPQSSLLADRDSSLFLTPGPSQPTVLLVQPTEPEQPCTPPPAPQQSIPSTASGKPHPDQLKGAQSGKRREKAGQRAGEEGYTPPPSQFRLLERQSSRCGLRCGLF